jgi:hypothetical protein
VPKKVIVHTKDMLIDAAQHEINGLNCLNKTFKKSSILNDQYVSVRDLLISKTQYNGFSLVKIDFTSGDAKISYLNIDAALEITRTRKEVYKSKNTLLEKLKNIGYIVSVDEEVSKTVIEKVDLTHLINERAKRIEHNIKIKDVQTLQFMLMNDELDSVEQYAYDSYITLQQYVDNDYLTETIIKYSKNKNSIKLARFLRTAELSIMEETSKYKQALSSQFIIGETYDAKDIHKRINRFSEKMGIVNQTIEEKKAVSAFVIMVEHTRNARKGNDAKTVKGFNPLKIPIIKYKSEFPEINEIFANIIGC